MDEIGWGRFDRFRMDDGKRLVEFAESDFAWGIDHMLKDPSRLGVKKRILLETTPSPLHERDFDCILPQDASTEAVIGAIETALNA